MIGQNAASAGPAEGVQTSEVLLHRQGRFHFSRCLKYIYIYIVLLENYRNKNFMRRKVLIKQQKGKKKCFLNYQINL